MKLTPVKNLIYLSSSQILPPYLQTLKGVAWHFAQSAGDLKEYLATQQGEIFVVVRSEGLSLRTVQAFLAWNRLNAKLSFIFIAQTIEKSVHQVSLSEPNVLVIFESEGGRIGEFVTRRLHGVPVRSRKRERKVVQSQVVIKRSTLSEVPSSGKMVQFLGEGCLRDFSQGGAQVALAQAGMRAKDFVSMMYRDCNGQWVSVESQVRWVASTPEGGQIIGLQFLAVSA